VRAPTKGATDLPRIPGQETRLTWSSEGHSREPSLFRLPRRYELPGSARASRQV